MKYLDQGIYIRLLHYLLRSLAFFDEELPFLGTTGNSVFDENTVKMVLAFQKKYGLPATGVVDRYTWGKLVDAYNELIENIPEKYLSYEDEFYGGRILSVGISGEDVRRLQRFLLKICREKRNIPGVRVTGTFDELTESSVKKLQQILELPVNGFVGAVVWNQIVDYANSKEP